MADRGMPSWESLMDFYTEISLHQFTLDKGYLISRTVIRLGLIHPRNVEGKEAGLVYKSFTGIDVIIWSSALWDRKKFRDRNTDKIWLIMRKGDNLLHSRPFYRSKNIFTNGRLLKFAIAYKERSDNAPLCRICKKSMVVAKDPKTGATWWNCRNPDVHANQSIRESFDFGLSKDSKKFLAAERKRRKKGRDAHKKDREAQGETVIPTRKRRKRFIATRPENKE